MDNLTDITKQQTNTGSLMPKQDGAIGVPEFTATKQTRMISEGAVTVAMVDECQRKTDRCQVLATANTRPNNVFTSDIPVDNDCENQEEYLESLVHQRDPESGNSQQPTVRNLVTEKEGTRERRPNFHKPKQMVEPYRHLRDLTQAKGYKYKAVKKLKVNRHSIPVYICIITIFIIIMVCMINIWILHCEVNRLEDAMRQRGLYLEDHTGMEKERLINEKGDNAILHDESNDLSRALDLPHVTPSDAIPLSRGVRQANDPAPAPDDPAPAGGKSKSKAKGRGRGKGNGRKKGKKRGKGKNLQVELYVGNWNSEYNPEQGLCGRDDKLPGKPLTCKSLSIMYPKKGSIVAFFEKDDTWTPVKKKKKKHTSLLEQNSKGQFVVKTTGTFLLHFNITINDETENKSLGIFLNGGILFACPPGGLRCPLTNEKDSSHFRLCTAHGVAKLEVNDVLDIRTMYGGMTIKVKLPSHFWAILLARHPGS